jgi:hypothetical protein
MFPLANSIELCHIVENNRNRIKIKSMKIKPENEQKKNVPTVHIHET